MTAFTLRGEWTKESIEQILGKPRWGWQLTQDKDTECGLMDGDNWTAGFGDMEAACRIHIHPDGICFYQPGGPFVLFFNTYAKDAAFTEATYLKLKQAQERPFAVGGIHATP